ncbi:hypothetical protein [Nocardia australiensis]|uniref:hypothetical protein n=1 Tax=Nocardia australiensis TaxID=2887191 RepID=UPI001D154442|nr:hypothetical protein [Nocardia australiensis]
MTDLVTRAQIILLARTLHVPAQRLAHLERLGAAHLHELQQRMASIMFDQHAEVFARISKLVPIIPLTISMPLVQRIVPPMMTGRAAGAVGVDHPKKAADTVALLGTAYAADCAPYMDPRTVGQLADAAPPDPIVLILNEILRRRDYITAGPFLAYATATLIDAVEQGVHDDAGLIFSAAYAFSAESVSAILRQLLNGRWQRIPRILHTVLNGSPDLQLAALSAFARCDDDVMTAVGDILFAVGTSESISNLIVTAIRVGAIAELLTFTGRMNPQVLDAMAANPVIGDEAALTAIIGALDHRYEPSVWRGLLLLIQRSDTGIQQIVARLVADLSDSSVATLPSIAAETGLWPQLLQVLASGDTSVHTRIGAVWARLPPERRAGLELHIHELQLDTHMAAITSQIPTISVEEVFFRRRQMRRHRGTSDSWPTR